jgi:hypothetical protein
MNGPGGLADADTPSGAPTSRIVWMAGAGWSMLPTFRPGDLLRLEPVTRPLRVGDVVALRRNGVWLIHRIVKEGAGDGLWLTKGDAMVDVDPPFRPEEVGGLVTARRRREKIVALVTDARRAALSGTLGARVVRAVPSWLRRLRRPVYLTLFLCALACRWRPERSHDRS